MCNRKLSASPLQGEHGPHLHMHKENPRTQQTVYRFLRCTSDTYDHSSVTRGLSVQTLKRRVEKYNASRVGYLERTHRAGRVAAHVRERCTFPLRSRCWHDSSGYLTPYTVSGCSKMHTPISG